MQHARKFVFSSAIFDKKTLNIVLKYRIEFADTLTHEVTESLVLPSDLAVHWADLPENLKTSLLQTLHLAFGIQYWSMHCAKKIVLTEFELTKEQSLFWNTIYQKGLGEFSYKQKIDLRELVQFPCCLGSVTVSDNREYNDSSLVAFGGGKDSLLVAHMLKVAGYSFDLFSLSVASIQTKAARVVGKELLCVKRSLDLKTQKLFDSGQVMVGHVPWTMLYMFTGVLFATLLARRYVIFANERSADEGNLEYLGEMVNHQWSKSAECEALIRGYVSRYITPNVTVFSLLKPISELEIIRRFSHLHQYHHSFSSCNENFKRTGFSATENTFWCAKCAKCAFIFAALAAFLPREYVVSIIGRNMYEDKELGLMFASLLGIGDHKPFECVGTADEMKVAMYRAYCTSDYEKTPIMQMFKQDVLPHIDGIELLAKTVFSRARNESIPPSFRSLI